MRVRVRACAYVCWCARVFVCLYVCVFECVCVCVCVSLRVSLYMRSLLFWFRMCLLVKSTTTSCPPLPPLDIYVLGSLRGPGGCWPCVCCQNACTLFLCCVCLTTGPPSSSCTSLFCSCSPGNTQGHALCNPAPSGPSYSLSSTLQPLALSWSWLAAGRTFSSTWA